MHSSKKTKKLKKKTKKALIRIIFSRFFLILIALVLEVSLLYYIFAIISSKVSFPIIILFNFIVTLIILNVPNQKDSYKFVWVIFINTLPGAGVLFYLYYVLQKRFNIGGRRLGKIIADSKKYNQDYFDHISKNIDIEEKNGILSYMYRSAGFYPYFDNRTTYFSNGIEYFNDVIEELKKAQKFIFIETFILSDGKIWQEIFEILKQKVSEGVEVKIMYDGLNTISSFDIGYTRVLREHGINAKMFAKIIPLLSSNHNNRDHRKIIVIDDKVAYTGGINIADEYANIYKRCGVWKDSAIKVKGMAAMSFTIMFLQVWHMTEEKNANFNYDEYLSEVNKNKKLETENLNYKNRNEFSYLIPYADYPSDKENVSEQLFKMMFNYSYRYIYVMTPYLILDESMLDTIIRAKKRGVDVKIFTPHIPDKKLIFFVTRCNYKYLLQHGVEVYEYTKGFVHSKVFLQDDKRAVVGTANLDFRSLYLHYEDGLYIYNDRSITDIKKDFEDLMKKSERIRDFDEIPKYQRFIGAILKVFASQF